MSNPQAEQLETIIASTVTALENSGALVINPAAVAHAVDQYIDPRNISPALKTYASIMEIRDQTRKYLTKRHDPVDVANDYSFTDTADMFSGQLQPYYPVKRDGGAVYAKLETLTRAEVKFAAARMRKAGATLIEHADALVAWDRGRKQVV